MFSLLHEYLITDLNTEKRKKYCQKNINYILENLFVYDMLSLNYVDFMFLQYVVNSQSCLKICLF